jgi:hypothetical protein
MVMTQFAPPTRDRAIRICVLVAVTAVASAGLLCAAALVPAPPGLLPFIIVVCIACPMLVAADLPHAVAGLRHHRKHIHEDARAIAEMRAGLAELPETSHPLGF